MANKSDLPTHEQWFKSANLSPDDFEAATDYTPMSDEQAHRLKALCWQRGERFDAGLSAEAAERKILELEARG